VGRICHGFFSSNEIAFSDHGQAPLPSLQRARQAHVSTSLLPVVSGDPMLRTIVVRRRSPSVTTTIRRTPQCAIASISATTAHAPHLTIPSPILTGTLIREEHRRYADVELTEDRGPDQTLAAVARHLSDVKEDRHGNAQTSSSLAPTSSPQSSGVTCPQSVPSLRGSSAAAMVTREGSISATSSGSIGQPQVRCSSATAS
jgi:hypothetical protein